MLKVTHRHKLGTWHMSDVGPCTQGAWNIESINVRTKCGPSYITNPLNLGRGTRGLGLGQWGHEATAAVHIPLLGAGECGLREEGRSQAAEIPTCPGATQALHPTSARGLWPSRALGCKRPTPGGVTRSEGSSPLWAFRRVRGRGPRPAARALGPQRSGRRPALICTPAARAPGGGNGPRSRRPAPLPPRPGRALGLLRRGLLRLGGRGRGGECGRGGLAAAPAPAHAALLSAAPVPSVPPKGGSAGRPVASPPHPAPDPRP